LESSAYWFGSNSIFSMVVLCVGNLLPPMEGDEDWPSCHLPMWFTKLPSDWDAD
jgi:hypothetical protein